MHLFVIPIWFNLSVVSIVTLAAYAWGGWRERLIASVMCARWYFATAAFLWPSWGPFGPPPLAWRIPVSAALLLAACLFAAWRGRRYWVILASAIALLELVTDPLELLDIGVSAWASRSAARIWMYLMSMTILWGVWTSRREGAYVWRA